MSENDGFDDIVNNEDEEEATPEFEDIMELVAYFWPKFRPGEIFVKGLVIVESVSTEGRGNYLESSAPITDSDILGFCEWGRAKVVADINADGWITRMEQEAAHQEEDDDSVDEDDE